MANAVAAANPNPKAKAKAKAKPKAEPKPKPKPKPTGLGRLWAFWPNLLLAGGSWLYVNRERFWDSSLAGWAAPSHSRPQDPPLPAEWARCDVAVVSRMDAKTFEAAYRGKVPFVLRGAHQHNESVAAWPARSKWGRGNFVGGPMRNLPVFVGGGVSIVEREHADDTGGGDGVDGTVTFGDYLGAMRDAPDSKAAALHRKRGQGVLAGDGLHGDAPYLFDRGLLVARGRLRADVNEPKWFGTPASPKGGGGGGGGWVESGVTDVDAFYFLVGQPNSSAAFHVHGDTWNGLVFGYKRWYLYDGNARTTPPPGYPTIRSMKHWVSDILPQLKRPEDQPLQCVQRPGDLLYLPEGFYHASTSLSETVAAAVSLTAPRDGAAPGPLVLLHRAAEAFDEGGSLEEGLRLCDAAREAFPPEAFKAELLAAAALARAGKPMQAQARIRAAHARNQWDRQTMLLLADSLSRSGDARDLEEAKSLLERAVDMISTDVPSIVRYADILNAQALALESDGDAGGAGELRKQAAHALRHAVTVDPGDLLASEALRATHRLLRRSDERVAEARAKITGGQEL